MYIDGFQNVEDIIQAFEAPADALLDAYVLYAKYRTGDYEGSAFVLYTKNNKMYEVNAGHCSCNGLEGQWQPEETSKESLEHRFFREGADWPYACETDEDRGALQKALLDEIAESILLRN